METSEVLTKLLSHRIEVCQGKISEDLQGDVMRRDMEAVFSNENLQKTLLAYISSNLSNLLTSETRIVTEDDIARIAYTFFSLGFCMKTQVDRIQFEKMLGEDINGK